MTDKQDAQQQSLEQQGAMFKPVHPEDANRQEELNRIRGMREVRDPELGPTNHTSNPSG